MRLPVLFLLTLSTAAVISCDSGIVDPTLAGDGALAAKGGGLDLAPPSNAAAVPPSDNRIDVTWQDNSTNESGFEVHRSTDGAAGNFILTGTWGANTVLHVETGLEGGKEYCYRVRATRRTGTKLSYSSFSNTACTTTSSAPLPPAAPTNLVAVGTSQTQIDLAWEDQSSNESSFLIRRSNNGELGPFFNLVAKAANSVAHIDPWVSAGTLYCYHVVAVREKVTENGTSYSYSQNSNIACASPVPPTAPPPSAYVVSAAPRSSSFVSVTVTWSDTSAAPSYRLYRSLDGPLSWELVASGSYSYLPAESERMVCYRAVAYNAAGDSEPSAAVCVVPPAGPTDLVATGVDATTLELTWTDNSAVESGYEVWRVDRWGDCYTSGWSEGETLVATLPPNTTSWRAGVMGYSCSETTGYYMAGYYIVAIRDGGRSDPSDEVSASDPAP